MRMCIESIPKIVINASWTIIFIHWRIFRRLED